MRDAVKKTYAYTDLVQKLWGVKPKVELKIDSRPLLQQLASLRAKAEPRYQGELEYLVEMINDLQAEYEWVPTTEMKADRQTKFKVND